MLEIIVFLVGLLIDRAAKILTMVYLQPTGVGTSVEAIPGILSFTYVENRGAAHGILQGQVWFFIPVTIIVCAFLVYFLLVKTHNRCVKRFYILTIDELYINII